MRQKQAMQVHSDLHPAAMERLNKFQLFGAHMARKWQFLFPLLQRGLRSEIKVIVSHALARRQMCAEKRKLSRTSACEIQQLGKSCLVFFRDHCK